MIDELTVDDTTTGKLPLANRRFIIALCAFAHDKSRKTGMCLIPVGWSEIEFQEYRIGEMRHPNPIVPFKIPVEDDRNLAARAWQKANTNIDRKDIPQFKDPLMWIKTRDKCVSRLKAHGMGDMVADPTNFRPADEDLDRTQRICLLYTSPSPRDLSTSRMPSSA